MLKESYDAGFEAAMQKYGGAWDTAKATASFVRKQITGEPIRAAREVWKGQAFKPGGIYNNLFWPSHPEGAGWGGKTLTWVGRLGATVFPAIEAVQALRGQGDPSQGRLSNALGAVGTSVGNAFGLPTFGMFGGPLLGEAGRRLGQGVGRLLGSRPRYMDQPKLPPAEHFNYSQGLHDPHSLPQGY